MLRGVTPVVEEGDSKEPGEGQLGEDGSGDQPDGVTDKPDGDDGVGNSHFSYYQILAIHTVCQARNVIGADKARTGKHRIWIYDLVRASCDLVCFECMQEIM